ncbi:MAG: hypothetical protein JXN65_02000 [Clostridia bacterium]|nr:hypothetical protein [Clostridia bacterium]
MKKLMIAMLILVMIFSVTACSKETTDVPTDESTPEAAQTQAPEQQADWEYDQATKTLYVNADMGGFEPDAPDFDGTTSNVPWSEYLPEIENIVVGDDVSYIGDYALAFCTNLQNAEIGPNVGSLDFRCFFKCGDFDNDSSIDFHFNSTPQFGEDVFGYTWDNPNVTIYVPDDMKDYWADFISQKGEMRLDGYEFSTSLSVDDVLYTNLWNPQWLWGENGGGFAENQGGEFGAGIAEKRYNEGENRLEIFSGGDGAWMPFNTRLRDCGPDNQAQQAVMMQFQPENISMLSFNFIDSDEFAINFESDGVYFVDVSNFTKAPFSDCVPNNFELKSDALFNILIAFDADANVRVFVWENGNDANQAYYETSIYHGSNDIFERNWEMVIGFGQNEQLNIYEYWIYTFDELMPMPYYIATGNEGDNGQNNDSEYGPSWSVNICGNFDIMSDMVWQSVQVEEVESGGDIYVGYNLAQIMNFSGNPYNTAKVILSDPSGTEVEVGMTGDAYIVYKKNGEFLGGPFLLYNNELTEYAIIQVESDQQ